MPYLTFLNHKSVSLFGSYFFAFFFSIFCYEKFEAYFNIENTFVWSQRLFFKIKFFCTYFNCVETEMQTEILYIHSPNTDQWSLISVTFEHNNNKRHTAKKALFLLYFNLFKWYSELVIYLYKKYNKSKTCNICTDVAMYCCFTLWNDWT